MANTAQRREIKCALKEIEKAQKTAARLAAEEKQLPEGGQWLLDNLYIAQREGRAAWEALKHFPAGRAFFAGRAFLEQPDWKVEEDDILAFLKKQQAENPFEERELCAFPAALCAALLRELARSCDHLLEDGGGERIGRCFTALRNLSALDFGPLLEKANQTEKLLRSDPAGVYPHMDEATRAEYRRQLAKQAKKQGLSEYAAAGKLLDQAQADGRHIGFYLFPQKKAKENCGGLYIAAVTVPSLFLTLLAGFLAEAPAVAVLLLLPISETVKNLLDALLLRVVKPRYVPRMDPEQALQPQARTLCVVSALLSSPAAGGQIARLLEQYRLANRVCGENLVFGILGDLPEGEREEEEKDADVIRAAQEAIEGLNEKYGGGFVLLLRPRRLAQADGLYMGWERKRGAILELARYLRGRESSMYLACGVPEALSGTQYVITLDADTRLNVGAAGELVAAMEHPLNRPVVEDGQVVSGYGLLAPRIGIELGAAAASDFARIFAGQGGVDPYGSRASDLYYDLYDEGSFTGKGIFQVDAYLACLESRFPENRILSHDLLEGAYLHCGYIGDVELSDGFPARVPAYFDRLHRWVRGDWQAARWLCARVPQADGKTVRNTLPQIDRWKLLDNLRRSLVPVFTFAALMTGLIIGGRDLLLAGAAALLSAASGLLIPLADGVIRPGGLKRRRFHASVIYGLAGAIMRLLLKLAFLPHKAALCFSAAVTALYRMLISKKHMLQWRTAAESEARDKGALSYYYRSLWPTAAAGVYTLAFSLYPFGAALGLYWLFAPAIARSIGPRKNGKKKLGRSGRLYLLQCAGDIWRYYTDFLRPEDHYLPPDNVQEEPRQPPAHRTSPTNIGLAMLSVLAASDLGLCDLGQLRQLLGCMLTTVEQLPKWQGHLYNWYDTRSLSPLQPPYVSTVDSGNLAGCLLTLREGLAGLDKGLSQRATALLEEMDFAPLYDPQRRLFRIGIDPECPERGADSFYDLMASEARLTSYYAVAKGQVPRKHWRRLGRGLTGLGGYAGMCSWTGTMFEYLMPNLLMPCYEDSLIWESIRFCIYAQKRAAGKRPWGVSESAFYALDPGQSYRYKAHGIQTLALKRGMGDEYVVSPYSSFLALPWCPAGAIRNLRRLAALGGEGRWGFIEALDFTAGRTGGGEAACVRTYMAHHLGMSLISIANTLLDGVMPRRFMADSAMAAYAELLQEKVPVGEIVRRQAPREAPEKPRRPAGMGWKRTGTGTDWHNPQGTLLSNGLYHVLALETGNSRSMYGQQMVARFERSRLEGSGGIHLYFQSGGETRSLLPAPDYSRNAAFSWRFSAASAEIQADFQDLEAVSTVWVPEGTRGELRRVSLKNKGAAPLDGVLALYFEPVLEKPQAYYSHPAFSKLALETKIQEDRVLVFRRGEETGLCLCCDSPLEADTSRELALGRGGEAAIAAALSREAGSSQGSVLDPCVLVRVRLRLKPGEVKHVRFALAVGEEAEQAAEAVLKKSAPAKSGRLDMVASSLGMGYQEVEAAMVQLPRLLFPPEQPGTGGGPQSLWPYGISGDHPLDAQRVEGPEQALELVRRQALLHLCGFHYDLALIINDGGDYRRPARSALETELRKAGLEALTGCFIVDEAAGDVSPLLAESRDLNYERCVQPPEEKPLAGNSGGEAPRFAWHFEADGSFVMTGQGALPPNVWSQMLSNGDFGAVMTETGSGHIWSGNARENRLTPWLNDSLAIRGPETLYVNGYSAFADLDGLPYTVRYGLGYAQWEKQGLRVTAFVPPGLRGKILLLENESGAPVRVRYGLKTEKQLPSEEEKDGIIVFENKKNVEFSRTKFYVSSSDKENAFTEKNVDKEIAFLTGACVKGGTITPITVERAKALFNETRHWWTEKAGAYEFRSPWPSLNHYMNGWALYQVMACRMLGRSSVYQSGGAFGFRDQLQDACALIETAPELTRRQILLACGHQYEEGDAQHWWHPTENGDRGVRTHCSDDLLWLPYVTAAYVEKTGDRAFLSEAVPYLRSKPLAAGEHDRYEKPEFTEGRGSVLEHCCRAVDAVLARGYGAHGLPYMGSGDWNDGYSQVGSRGKGESVWLAWFLAMVLEKIAPFCDAGTAARYSGEREKLLSAAGGCWDGDHFLRGYFDDGTPLGAGENRECRVDSIAQSFAALAGYPDREKVKTALKTAVEQLFDREHQVVKILTPPFSGAEPNPGYISRYPAGVRENGGQYTHGAIWLAMACFEVGMRQEGLDILLALLPEAHPWESYRTEPYVLAADVYSNPQHLGRGGWSWYTGAAGWYVQAVRRYLPEYFI